MGCPEIYDEDVYDFILKNREKYLGTQVIVPVCQIDIGEEFQILYTRSQDAADLNIYHYTYSAIPTVYSPQAENYMRESCIDRVKSDEVLGLNGNGVILGFVDSGIDLTDEQFQFLGGGSRVVTFWNQEEYLEVETTVPYGKIYTQQEINEGLNAGEQLPGDELGHGSYVAGIAAGTIGGIAPQADIAVVKLKNCKNYLRDYYGIPQDTVCYQENDVMTGIKYLEDFAQERGKPLILCFCLGTNQGSHTGNSNLSQLMNRMTRESGKMVVCAAGNEALKRHHYQGQVMKQNDSEIVEIQVEEGQKGFMLECWSQAPQGLSIDVISPSGERMEGVVARTAGQTDFRFKVENTYVEQAVRLVTMEGGQQVICTRFENPTPGIWKLQVMGRTITTGIYNMWLPLQEQMETETVFIRSEPYITITEPGNASSILTVAAYNGQSGGVYIQSGRGFTANNQIKPDIAAPGSKIVSPYNQQVESSTSAAAGITAGAAALYMQWAFYVRGDTVVTGVGLKYGLILGAKESEGESYPNQQLGYGKLCLFNTIRL